MSNKEPYRVEHIRGETLLYYRHPVDMEDVIEYCDKTFEDYSSMNIHLIRPSPEPKDESNSNKT